MNKHSDPGVGRHGERTPEGIEREIELTRERMSNDLEDLGERRARNAIRGGIVEFVRQHPVPVAAAGLGAAWLLSQGNRSERIRPRRRSRGLVDDNPLAVAAGAAVLGLCVGLMVSSSEREHGWTRPIGDKLKDATGRVREVVREEAPSIEDAASPVEAKVKRAAGRTKDGAKRATKKE